MNSIAKVTTVAIMGLSGTAFAGLSNDILSFTYSDLAGSYNATTGEYSAVVSAGNTSGDVTYVPGNQTAEFDSGSFASTSAGFSLDLAISNVMATTADAAGTLTITDANGDTITADVLGSFNLSFGSVFFQGALSNAFVNDNTSDGSFDGTTAGSFATAIAGQPFNGSIVELFFNNGNFFAESYDGRNTLASGLLVPTPGAVALLGFAGLTAVRRRR